MSRAHRWVARLRASDPPAYLVRLAIFNVVFMPLGIATTALVLPLYVRHRERRPARLLER